MNKKNLHTLLIFGLLGLTMACTTTPDPTPSTDVSAETIKKITDYGTSKGLTFTKTTDQTSGPNISLHLQRY